MGPAARPLPDPPEDVLEYEEDWGREVERRLGEIDAGTVELVPGDEAMQRLRARLAER